MGVLFASQIPWRMAFAGLLRRPSSAPSCSRFPCARPGGRAFVGPQQFAGPLSVLLFLFVYVETGLTSWIPFLSGTPSNFLSPQPQWIFAAFWAAFLLARLFISLGAMPSPRPSSRLRHSRS